MLKFYEVDTPYQQNNTTIVVNKAREWQELACIDGYYSKSVCYSIFRYFAQICLISNILDFLLFYFSKFSDYFYLIQRMLSSKTLLKSVRLHFFFKYSFSDLVHWKYQIDVRFLIFTNYLCYYSKCWITYPIIS